MGVETQIDHDFGVCVFDNIVRGVRVKMNIYYVEKYNLTTRENLRFSDQIICSRSQGKSVA